MTLLEVMLSLALLGGAIVVIGEIARTAFQNAQSARNLVQAELLAESILAKIRLGIIPMEPAYDEPVGLSTANPADIVLDTHAVSAGNISNILWVYSVEIASINNNNFAIDLDEYLIEISVTVRQNVPAGQRAAVSRVVRWFAIEPEVPEDEQG